MSVLELAPEDMTVTVESGITVGALQKELKKHRQWLPIDPPNAETTTIHDVLAQDMSGPRRFGYGTIREHLIGMKVALADGRLIKSGGKVVKNVAGYDLAKLFIGAQGTLGTIVEATFKLRPLPEQERIFGGQFAGSEAGAALRTVLNSPLTPVILDLWRSADSHACANQEHADPAARAPISIVLGLAGTREEVEWQANLARELGFTTDTTLDYEATFWNDAAPAHRLSVLPSKLMETIAKLDGRPFVARAGNGAIYHRGAGIGPRPARPDALLRRIKTAFDPNNIFPEMPA